MPETVPETGEYPAPRLIQCRNEVFVRSAYVAVTDESIVITEIDPDEAVPSLVDVTHQHETVIDKSSIDTIEPEAELNCSDTVENGGINHYRTVLLRRKTGDVVQLDVSSLNRWEIDAVTSDPSELYIMIEKDWHDNYDLTVQRVR